MALSGLHIFKLLPKTNCKDCGYPTCMAFALQLGTGRAAVSACPHLAADVLATLADVATAPVRRVEIGPAEGRTIVGEETVLYRHEKRFEHAPALAVLVDDSLDDEGFDWLVEEFRHQQFERVGEILRPRLLAVGSADTDRLKYRVRTAAERTGAGIVIVSDDPEALLAAGGPIKEWRPLLCGAGPATFDRVAEVARTLGVPFVLRGQNLEELAGLGRRALDAGFEQVVLEPVVETAGDALQAHVFVRRAAVRDKIKALGFPTIAFPCRLTDDPLLQTVLASALVAKYAGIVVVDTIDPAHNLPLLALAQGLFTDPQKPMMVDAGIYPVGLPGPESPVLLTTNFSLTYYTVVGEVQNSKVPAWLLVMDVEGQSVLTAWAAGKFVADAIAPFVKKSGIEDKVVHRRLIIPGRVAGIRAELEAELGDWEVSVGVREAADIPRYLRALPAGDEHGEVDRAEGPGRKPEWLKKPLPDSGALRRMETMLRDRRLHTVCESALCPNLGECFARGTATFLIMGDVCTRDCGFCGVASGRPLSLEADEPQNVAEAVARLQLQHVVVTSVTRDDLGDGGAAHYVATMRAIRCRAPEVTVEVLVPDFAGRMEHLDLVLDEAPEVFNHNVETVPRLYKTVRPQAVYERSLAVLRRAAERNLGLVKTGWMVGLGETEDEVKALLGEVAEVGVDMVTIGQYLRPSGRHLPVTEYVRPEVFVSYRLWGEALGLQVHAAPFVRSSFQAGESFARAKRRGGKEDECSS